jgi:hypothetical protein
MSIMLYLSTPTVLGMLALARLPRKKELEAAGRATIVTQT